jgi:hypothetical protein
MGRSNGKAAKLIVGILLGLGLLGLSKGCDFWESHRQQVRVKGLFE